MAGVIGILAKTTLVQSGRAGTGKKKLIKKVFGVFFYFVLF